MSAKQELQDALKRDFKISLLKRAGEGLASNLYKDAGFRKSAVMILFIRGENEKVDQAENIGPGSNTDQLSNIEILLTKRADNTRYHSGQISFPGGGIDPGESVQEAAKRKALEETGIDPALIEVLGKLPEVNLPVSSNLVTPVVGWCDAANELRFVPDGKEIVSTFRVPVSELLNPASRGITLLKFVERTYRGPAFTFSDMSNGKEHVIWGFTAILLDALFENLGWAIPWDGDNIIPLEI